MNPRHHIRNLIAKIKPWLIVVLAGAGFLWLSRGMTTGSGVIQGYAEVQVHSVGSRQAGRLQEVLVHLGQSVHKGEVIARLDRKPLELQRESMRAQLALAAAQLEAAGDSQYAQLQRGQLQAVRTHAAEEKARAQLAELNKQLQRLQVLGSEHLIRAAELEKVREQQSAVQAELIARTLGTTREEELMGLRPRTEAEQLERLRLRLEPFSAAQRVKEAALRELELAIEETTLRAPVDGTVDAILQWPGDVLNAGAPVVTMVTLRPGYITAYVPERHVQNFSIGTAVKMHRPGALRGRFRGHVVELAPMVEEMPPRARPSPTFPLWGRHIVIQIDDPMPLIPGEAFGVSIR